MSFSRSSVSMWIYSGSSSFLESTPGEMPILPTEAHLFTLHKSQQRAEGSRFCPQLLYGFAHGQTAADFYPEVQQLHSGNLSTFICGVTLHKLSCQFLLPFRHPYSGTNSIWIFIQIIHHTFNFTERYKKCSTWLPVTSLRSLSLSVCFNRIKRISLSTSAEDTWQADLVHFVVSPHEVYDFWGELHTTTDVSGHYWEWKVGINVGD